MNSLEYHAIRRKKFAELCKKRVDSAYEYYCQLSDEEKQVAEFTFARKLCKHMCLSMGIARNVTSKLIAEYNIEFSKFKKPSSFGFTGRSHSAKTREAIAKATIARNKARAIMCAEKGLNYRNYKQDSDKQIDVVNFSNTFSKARAKSIDSDKIII